MDSRKLLHEELDEILRLRARGDRDGAEVLFAWFARGMDYLGEVESADCDRALDALFGPRDKDGCHDMPFLYGDTWALIKWLRAGHPRPISEDRLRDAEYAAYRRGVPAEKTDALIRELSLDGHAFLDTIPTARRPEFIRRVARLRPSKRSSKGLTKAQRITAAIWDAGDRGVTLDQIKALRDEWTGGQSAETMTPKAAAAFIEKLAEL